MPRNTEEKITTQKESSPANGKEATGPASTALNEEWQRQMQFQQLVTTLSTRFISLPAEQFDRAVNQALQQIGKFSGVDRSYVFLLREQGQTLDNTHEWCAPGISPQRDRLQALPAANFPWWMEKLHRLEPVHIPRVADLPPEAAAEKTLLQAQDIQSLLAVPIAGRKKLIGFIGFDAVRGPKSWSQESIALLRLVGNMLAGAIERKQAEEKLVNERNLLRTLIDNLPDYIYVKDTKSRFVLLNKAAMRPFDNTDINNVIGKTDFDFHPPELAQKYYADEQALLQSGRSHITVEEPVIEAGGAQKWLLTTKVLLHNSHGKVTGLVGIGRDITERKEAMEALRRSEARYHTLFDGVPVGLYRTTTAGKILDANLALVRMLGYPNRDALLAVNADNLYADPQSRRRFTETISRQGAIQNFEAELRRRDGSTVWVRISSRLVQDADTRESYYEGVMEDITDRKQARDALKASEARYRELVQSANSIIMQFDPQGRIVFMNEYGQKFFGYTEEEITGRSIVDTILPAKDSKGQNLSALIQDICDNPKKYAYNENENICRDGRRVWVAWTNKALLDVEGRPTGVLCIGTDITDRKLMEDALRESKQRFHTLFENSPDGIILIDPNSTEADWPIIDCNNAACQMNGYSREELIGQSIDILHPEPADPAERAAYLAHLRQAGQKIVEAWHRHKDGRLFPIEAVTNLITLSGREIVMGIDRDITERKQAEEALRRAKEQAEQLARAAKEASRAKSEFLANMSHEIRTPLNGVIGMTGLLLDTNLNAEQRDYAETIRRSGDTLLTIINDILDFSKIEAGKLELETQPFDLRLCIEDSLDLLAPKAAEKGLDLAYIIEDQTPEMLIGDVTRLRQILVNLLSNAVKFTEKGEVVVSVTGQSLPNRKHQIHFAVKDTGIGIPKDRMHRLFRSFSQVDASTTRKYGGTGLGLTISKRLSEMMGGSMWVESDGIPGRGATFHFTIQVEPAPEQLQRFSDNLPQLDGKYVLIVDDNETNRRILTKQVEMWGMHPLAASSGPEALELIRRHSNIDIAILDKQMPEMDGLTLANQIHARHTNQAIPLILLTSLGVSQQDVAAARFAALLTKPIKSSQLYNSLVNVFAEQPVPVKRRVSGPKIDPTIGRKNPLHILLAEDNLVNQKVALRLLDKMGYRADVAANGLEVLEALKRQPYDVVLMDIQMPEMDGVEATRRIRQEQPAGRQPRIIALTADALSGTRERYLAAGMDDYISKPIQIKELIEALGKCKPLHNRPGPEEAATADPDPDAVLNPAVLDEFQAMLGDDGPAMVTELITTFLEDAPNLLAQLRQAIAQNNAPVVQRTAHTLKSNGATFGAVRFSEMCRALEEAGRNNRLAGTAEKAAQLEAEFEQVKEHLAGRLSG